MLFCCRALQAFHSVIASLGSPHALAQGWPAFHDDIVEWREQWCFLNAVRFQVLCLRLGEAGLDDVEVEGCWGQQTCP